jgi:hypothetical protein
MTQTLGRLLAEADQIISGRSLTNEKTAAATTATEDAAKLAAALVAHGQQRPQEKTAAPVIGDIEGNSLVKVAHALAIVDTLFNLPVIVKMAEFEKAAAALGHSEDTIADFFEKNAQAFETKSVLELMPWLQAD